MDTTTTALSPTFEIQRANERAFADHGWLKTYHSFSFADYFDPANLSWGALRVFNDDTVAGGTGFGTHPHRDMEILTYVLSGELEHKDSMGNVGVVGAGGVQYLSAGTGISHSEYNHQPDAAVRLVQMWVLPRAQHLSPQYGQVDYTAADRDNRSGDQHRLPPGDAERHAQPERAGSALRLRIRDHHLLRIEDPDQRSKRRLRHDHDR